MNWTNFTINEIVNPNLDDCPYNWLELPGKIKRNLIHTMELIQKLRSYIKEPIRINSTYRPKDKGSHGLGKAIDIQFYEDNIKLYKLSMNWFQFSTNNGFRVIMEWNGRIDGIPWFHIDRNYKDYGGKVLMVSYPIKNKRSYKLWEGIMPNNYL